MNKELPQSQWLSLEDLELNEGQLSHLGLPENPRGRIDEKITLLKKDIEDYPDFLEYRTLLVYPMYNGKYITIGGNMRLVAMREMGLKEAPCMVLDKATPIERLKAYVILDNSQFGNWDWNKLTSDEWDYTQLESWGVSIPENWDESEEEPGEEEPDGGYTTKVEIPDYTPSGNTPDLKELVDLSKTEELTEEIRKSAIPSEVKDFLYTAAQRHAVFNYEKIADYYANAPKEVQILMERSALVIIDFNQAIENGFVSLTKELAKAYKSDKGIAEDSITEAEILAAYDEE